MPRPLNSTDTDLTADNLLRLPAEFGCPVWVYDAQIIRAQIAKLSQFDVVRFAQKACSNIHILRLMREQGVKVDSVSLGEIERALAAGFVPGKDEIVFTADMIDEATLARVHELSIPVNAGSVDMLEQLGQVSPGHRVWLRVNPGFGHGHSQKTNTGGENSKHGIWYSDLPAALEVIQRYKLKLVGIHMHIGSGVDYAHLEQVCGAMVRQVVEFGQDLEAISAGGGLSIPYREGEEAIDTDHYFGLWNAAREQIAKHLGHPVKLELEPGRFLVAWHPKSSTENERTTTVVRTPDGKEVLFRQIAGLIARRIVSYMKVGSKVEQNSVCGFIKFGSRIDILLPKDTELLVEIGDPVVGSQTPIARLK